MRITIVADIAENSRVPQWLIDAVRQAERAGQTITVTASKKRRPANA